ncbi:MAG: haloacid dehalogenase-like hydrolase [Bacilli bacterium]
MNVYDFDKTIYDGDSSIDFYIFSLKKKPYIILLFPIIVFSFVMYKLRIKEKEYYKEKFFMFLKFFRNPSKLVNEFWDKHQSKIKKWYLEQRKDDDLIITASPYFLISVITNRLGIKNLIASDVDINNGKFLSKNCYGVQKTVMYRKKFDDISINSFYSDSMSDLPMMKLAENAYIVNKNDIKKIDL